MTDSPEKPTDSNEVDADANNPVDDPVTESDDPPVSDPAQEALDTSGTDYTDESEYDPYADHDDYYYESPFTHPGMPQVTIPPSQLHHGKLAMGSWVFGGEHWGGQDIHDSRSVMEAAIRRGMNHFDTADSFGHGRSEILISQFLEADYHRREGIFLSTQTMLRDADPQTAIDRLNASLDRLETYWIDLFYISWPSPTTDMRPVFEALSAARDEGKIKSLGVAHFTIEQMEQVQQVCELNACQLTYNLLWRHAENELLPYCHEHGISVVTTSSLAQGILAGKFSASPRFAAGDIRPSTTPFAKEVWPRVHEVVERCQHVAREQGRPLAHLALRWIARNPAITSIVVGARNARQLNVLAGAMAGDINDDLLDQLTAISDELENAWPPRTNLFQYCP